MGRDKTIDDMIRKAGWFKGSERQWTGLPEQTKKDLAFAGCGCEVAYPTWEGPVDCVHTGCQIRRGEIKPLIMTNRILRGEIESGWLRFAKDSTEGRISLARTIKAIRRAAVTSGVYNPWEIPGGWQAMVSTGISA